jgi:FixJ family two-component response regulator
MNKPSQPNPAVIHVVDDDESFRRAISRLLQAAGYAVKQHSSAGAFLLALPGSDPGCVVLDVRLPGPSGLDLQDALARSAAGLPIVFVSGHADVATSVRAMKAGAVDFLTKPVKRDTLLAAVREAVESGVADRSRNERRRALLESHARLTPREKQVFDLVIAGRLNKQIALELGMAERTVKFHRGQVMAKMGVASLAELVHASDAMG